jgi:hypothetical protein
MKAAKKTSGKVKKSAFNRGSHVIKSGGPSVDKAKGKGSSTKYPHYDPAVVATLPWNQEE